MSSVVKKQHYVWRKYLQKWIGNNNKLFVLRKNTFGTQKAIESAEVEKVGFEKFFYDISGFSEKDINFYSQFLTHIQINEPIFFDLDINMLLNNAKDRDFIETKVMAQLENLDNKYNFLEKLANKDYTFYQDTKVKTIMDELNRKIFFEIIGIEYEIPTEFYVFINKILQNPEILSSTDNIKFMFHEYLCAQYFRSPKVFYNQKSIIENLKNEKEAIKDIDYRFFINLFLIYASTKMAFSITHNYKTVLEILENNTNLDFITCDSPVINLTGKDFKNPTVFYYPITPKIAIKLKIYDLFYDINNDINNKVIIINDDNVNEIIELNKIVFKNSYNEIYSNNEETLKSFLCSQH